MPRPIAVTSRGRKRVLTVSLRELRLELERGGPTDVADELLVDEERPRTRGECVNGLRPCPFVGCRHHLYLEVNSANGSIKFNFPHLEPWELARSCSLDVADDGETTLESIGALLNLTREAVRQQEERAFDSVRERQRRARGAEV